jgi:UDP-N-acetylglucosamine--N-acetylmuramyl-(pentapeptide) pyrophosphoryl-undecaprenol N-acetylglucosamine transferase
MMAKGQKTTTSKPRARVSKLAPQRVLVASGASGGHLFPALAVAQELRQRGHVVTLVLGGAKFMEIVQATGLPVVRLPAAAFNDRGVVGLVWAVVKLLLGFGRAWRLVRATKPAVVFGTGGYATVALILAAKVQGVPTVIHEQNVLPGRANWMLARWAALVLLTFAESKKYLPCPCGKVLVAGTPLRQEILQAAKKAAVPSKFFRMLVLGGSQGSRILSEVVPDMLGLLSAKERASVVVMQQARAEDAPQVQAALAKLGLAKFEVVPFFKDMPARYAAADLLIGRSGVGTVLEAALFGVPAIYVPLELADGHQKLNAAVAENAGAAVVVGQPYFTPANLLVQVRALMQDPARRAAMRTAALTLGNPNATAAVTAALEDLMRPQKTD